MNGLLIAFWGVICILFGCIGDGFTKTVFRIITVIFGFILLAVGYILSEQPYYFSASGPTAMDVYQGKTRLEIHYTDSIPTDSIVVYVDEYKKEK